jgi:histidine triad (HIT) family protein
MSEKTIFEKIIAGEIPCTKIYEDQNIFAFLDINPSNYGHTLVVPKKPYKNIYELPDEISGELFKKVKQIATAIKKSLKTDGVNIIMNNESVAGQIVFHAHIHIIPRYKNDGGYYNNKNLKYTNNQAQEYAQKIIANL